MNFSPKRPCKHPGCPALVAHGAGTYCAAHKRSVQQSAFSPQRLADHHRGSAASRGYDADWQRARFSFLARYPLCAGVLLPTEQWTVELAIELHHERERRRERGELLWLSALFAAISPRMTGENCGQTPGGEHAATVSPQLSAFSFQPWDISRPAVVVDHIIPHKGDHLLMWAEWNWQPLTKRAHDRKTATEQKAPRNFNTEAAEIAE